VEAPVLIRSRDGHIGALLAAYLRHRSSDFIDHQSMCRWRDGLAELIFALQRPQRLTMLRGRCACTRRAYQTADDVVASATITFDRPRLPWQLLWRDHISL